MIRGTAWYVFSSQEHRQPNVPISVSMHLPRCCFFTWLFGTGRGSVLRAIPLTRLHIVVLARGEDSGASTRVHVRASAYLREDFGVRSGSRRDEERDMRNGIRTWVRRNMIQCGRKVTEMLVTAITVPARGYRIVTMKPYRLLLIWWRARKAFHPSHIALIKIR